MTSDATQLLKKAFAEAWLYNPSNAFAAALEVTGGDAASAMEIAQAWVYDREVRKYKLELIAEHGEDAFVATKVEMLQDILTRAKECPHNDDYAKLMKLAADMRGFIEKPGVNVTNNTNITSNKVMSIPVFMNPQGIPLSDDEWEQQLISNQESLTNR